MSTTEKPMQQTAEAQVQLQTDELMTSTASLFVALAGGLVTLLLVTLFVVLH